MRRLILGTAGHIDHGKTALVRALTGIDTDRLPEEKRRGITIDLGFAALTLPSGTEFGIVDVPGHEAFVRNMLAGATGVDLALLVVAADEGVMPQTREHLAILELLGVRTLVVALTKVDLVEADWLDLVREEVRELLAGGDFAAAPIVPVSARTGVGLEPLRQALDEAAAGARLRAADDVFRMPIDRVFTIQGTGTVVTGTVWSGTVERDQQLTVLPAGRTARVRGLQSHGHDRAAAGPGERTAVALVGLSREDITRGDTLVREPGWIPASMVTARLRVLSGAAAVRTRQRIRFHLGTAEILGRVVVLDGPSIEPGDEGIVQLRLEEPVVARACDRFVIRSYSPVTTIAGGIVLEPAAPKRRRLGPDDAKDLDTLATGSVQDVVATLIRTARWSGIEPDTLPIRSGAPPATVNAACSHLVAHGDAVSIGGRLFDAAIVAEAEQRILAGVDRVHAEYPLRPGADRDELRRTLPPYAPGELASHVFTGLINEGRLEPKGAALRRSGHEPVLTTDQAAALDTIARTYAEAGLTPPSLDELPSTLTRRADLHDLLRLLEDRGAILPLRHDLYIDRGAVDAAVARLREPGVADHPLTPAEFRQIFGISRKYLIPLLEYLDRAGVTARHGDARSVNPL